MESDDAPPAVPDPDPDVPDVRDVALPASGFDFQVRTIPPREMLSALEERGLLGLVQTGSVANEEYADLLQDDDFIAFMEEAIVPNVRKPAVYLEDPAAGSFNLATLDPDDVSALIAGVMATDDAYVTVEF